MKCMLAPLWVRRVMAYVRLTEILTREATSLEEGVVPHDVCKNGREVRARRLAPNKEAFLDVGFQDRRVGHDLLRC